jgi:hypothetical protein
MTTVPTRGGASHAAPETQRRVPTAHHQVAKLDLSAGTVHTVLVDGEPHIVFRHAVEAIGLDYSAQLRKLRDRSWANRREVATVAADGKVRQMAVVDEKTFLMWLATVNEMKVAPEVRPVLVAYQSETTDLVRDYWTRGGAVNPRATADQLDAIIGRAKAQAEVLRVLDGIVDSAWLDAKARHVAARALGEEPEIDPTQRPLTVGEYLEDKGVTGEALRSLSTTFGKRLKRAYRDRYGAEPGTVDRFVSGALRPVAAYTEQHRSLFDAVWSEVAR